MAKLKVTLVLEPTFSHTVALPIPGGQTGDVKFTFKWLDRDQFKVFSDGLKDKKNIDGLMEIVTGWDLPDEFNHDNMARLLDKYLGAAAAIFDAYFAELTGARVGN